jgi:hypothetical protein
MIHGQKNIKLLHLFAIIRETWNFENTEYKRKVFYDQIFHISLSISLSVAKQPIRS